MLPISPLLGFCIRQTVTLAGESVIDFCRSRLSDQSRNLLNAVKSANDRSWKVIELALGGEGLLSTISSFVANKADEREFSQRIKRLLDTKPIGNLPSAEFRQTCLQQLRLARKTGLLSADIRSLEEIADPAGSFQQFTDPQGLLSGAWGAVGAVASSLQPQYPQLAELLRLPVPDGPPLLVSAFSYFLRREVAAKADLERALSFEMLEQLSADHVAAFSDIDRVLSALGDKFDEMMVALVGIGTEVEAQGRTLEKVYQKLEEVHSHQRLQQREAPPRTPLAEPVGWRFPEPGLYDELLSAKNPSCFLILIDQSATMQKPFGLQSGLRKADGAAAMINSILDELTLQLAQGENLYIGIIGYGNQVGSALGGRLANRKLASTKELLENPLARETIWLPKKKPDGTEKPTAKPITLWIKPRADGRRTPMAEAFAFAHDVLKEFLKKHPESFPPIVLNVTDGQPNTGNRARDKTDPELCADVLRNLASTNGNVLLANAHLSEHQADPIVLPQNRSVLPSNDTLAARMYQMSSVIPDLLVLRARFDNTQLRIDLGSRAFAFNSDLSALLNMFKVATSSYSAGAGYRDLRAAYDGGKL